MDSKTQFTVALCNRPGELATLCRKLSDAKVNIEAISVANTGEMGLVRIVVSNMSKATTALKAYDSTREDVLLITAENKPGELESIARGLSRKNVNIEYVYGSASPDGESVIVMKTSDPNAAKKILT